MRGATDNLRTYLTRLEHMKAGELNEAIRSLVA